MMVCPDTKAVENHCDWGPQRYPSVFLYHFLWRKLIQYLDVVELFKLRLIQTCICWCFAISCPFVDVFYAMLFYIRKPVLWMFLDLPTAPFELNLLDKKKIPPVKSIVKTEQGRAQMKLSHLSKLEQHHGVDYQRTGQKTSLFLFKKNKNHVCVTCESEMQCPRPFAFYALHVWLIKKKQECFCILNYSTLDVDFYCQIFELRRSYIHKLNTSNVLYILCKLLIQLTCVIGFIVSYLYISVIINCYTIVHQNWKCFHVACIVYLHETM